jgi:LmbE family N-acetylglucosaminyl deacetylase
MKNLSKTIIQGLYKRLMPHPVKNAINLSLILVERFHRPKLIPLPKGKKVLVLAPHMDDEIIGCGGTLRKHILAGSEIAVLYLTDGKRGDPTLNLKTLSKSEREIQEKGVSAIRKEEAYRAAEIIGFNNLTFLDHPDGALFAGREVIEGVKDVIRQTHPDLLYLPFLTDRHHDHWQTNCIFIEAMRRLGKGWDNLQCCGYEVWSPIYPNCMVDIKEVIDVKRRALEQFKSQLQHTDYVNGILGLNSYRSVVHLKGRGYAEAFFLSSFKEYRDLYSQLIL